MKNEERRMKNERGRLCVDFGAELDSHHTERRAGFRARFARRSLSQVVSSQAVPPADERRAKVSASLKTIAQRPAKSRCAQNPGVQLETPAFFVFHSSFFILHFSVSDFASPSRAWKQGSQVRRADRVQLGGELEPA